MNAIMDLTARATSFITVIQSALLKGAIAEKNGEQSISVLTIPKKDFEAKFRSFIAIEKKAREEQEAQNDYMSPEKEKKQDEDSFDTRAQELVWISTRALDAEKATEYTIRLCVALVEWIWENKSRGINKMQEEHKEYPTPYNWRETISDIIYKNPEQRISLAVKLQYLPVQIVLALGAGKDFTSRSQRVMQMWMASDKDRKDLLTPREYHLQNRLESWEKEAKATAVKLLEDDHELFRCLVANNVPLSFEYVFKAELQEITRNRIRRLNEELVTTGQAPIDVDEDDLKVNDPYTKGKKTELYALAFSGGGIRSATFNLGILEGIAKNNLISKFDYLSTVSGGGYIGSWLAAWIKRDGSVIKVSNRLCPDKSPDPLGEELKPIKWLRMFSNYFAPNASIMSADSWTVGMTWLRNTLLNQVIIFLLLLSVLFCGNFLYEIWLSYLKSSDSNYFEHDLFTYWKFVSILSTVLLVPVSILAGLGMHAYNSDSNSYRSIRIRREWTIFISNLIIIIAVVGSYFISAWLASTFHITDPSGIPDLPFYNKLKIFTPAALIAFCCLLIVAIMGNYVKLIKDFKEPTSLAVLTVLGTAFLATVTGLIGFASLSVLLEHIPSFIQGTKYQDIGFLSDKIQFILGVPLTLEIFSSIVVVRMALLGKYFPDERREWWGRMGAHVHRIAFIWILVSVSALLGQEFVHRIFKNWTTSIAATGGWIALVGSTVKAAFSSQTSGKDGKPGTLSVFLDILGKAGPYLFLLGLLIFLPALIKPSIQLEKIFFEFTGLDFPGEVFLNLYLMLFLLFIAYWLAKQVGVNEFTMHHFYKNRLVRAYLGATRRSTDRQQTANPFTGFDMKDDEKLYELQHKHGYYGPYPILNAALNASQKMDLDRQDRKAESFIFSPLFCGFDFSMARSSADVKTKSYDYAFRETKDYAYPDGGPTIGTAMATSGAAVNPNQGYHSSAATAFLLTVFNVQMGRWIGNPRKSTWQNGDPKFGLGYIMYNLIGKTSTRNDFIALSDGGHFDNMGLYEMVRRRCKVIVLCDAEQDDQFNCEGLANAIRRCRIDFGAEIHIDISKIIGRPGGRFSEEHFKIGTIKYAGDRAAWGKLLYIKSSITANLPVDIQEYAAKNKTFPHQTTADQFFDEEQFESYRRLGLHIADKIFSDPLIKRELEM